MEPPLVARHVLLLVLVSLASASGCRRPQPASLVSDSVFVAVMADLKRVQDAPGMDSAQRVARRDSILRSRALTPAQLEAVARQLAHNPARAQTVWQAIERRSADTTQAK